MKSHQVLWSILYHSNFGRCGSRCALERPGEARDQKALFVFQNNTLKVQADLARARPAAAACRAVCADPAQSPLPRQRLPWKEPANWRRTGDDSKQVGTIRPASPVGRLQTKDTAGCAGLDVLWALFRTPRQDKYAERFVDLRREQLLQKLLVPGYGSAAVVWSLCQLHVGS